jgi:hypothetical protein
MHGMLEGANHGSNVETNHGKKAKRFDNNHQKYVKECVV